MGPLPDGVATTTPSTATVHLMNMEVPDPETEDVPFQCGDNQANKIMLLEGVGDIATSGESDFWEVELDPFKSYLVDAIGADDGRDIAMEDTYDGDLTLANPDIIAAWRWSESRQEWGRYGLYSWLVHDSGYGSNSEARLSANVPGLYRIEIAAGGDGTGTGTYQVKVRLNNFCVIVYGEPLWQHDGGPEGYGPRDIAPDSSTESESSTGNPASWVDGFLGDNWDEDPDEDWWKVQLTQGYQYTVELRTRTDWAEEHQATDLKILGIYDQSGTAISDTASSRSGKSVNVVFQPDTTGLYYISVGSSGPDRTGIYRIRATEEELAGTSGRSGSGSPDQKDKKDAPEESPADGKETAQANSPAQGLPSVTGTAEVGQTLTADTSGISDDDGLTNVSYSYQWVRNDGSSDTDIQNGTDSTYTPVAADAGRTLKVTVSFTDDGGNDESLTSTATGEVEPRPNSPATGAPTITGTAQIGETLTSDISGIADDDGLDNASYSYQWVQNDGTSDTDITGATDSSYTLVAADEGKTVKVRVSFTDQGGYAESLTSDATDAVSFVVQQQVSNSPASGAPAITGTAQVGETLTADTSTIADADGLDNVAYSYQWVANDGGTDTDISGATDSGYTLIDADEGRTIRVRVSFTDDGGNDETLTSAATAAVDAAPNNPATGAPAITGTAQVGETLTTDTSGIADADGLTNVSYGYQWIRNDGSTDTDIQDATGSSYTLVDADEGKTIKVEVSFTDDGGNDESLTSTATGEVEPRPNSPATGAPTISGTAQVGETLTADTSAIADANGLTNATFRYQWVHNNGTSDTDITGATNSGYTLVNADEGRTIKVRVSFTDDAGNDETLTSTATAAVDAAPNNPATGAPAITGTAQVGETLTADTSGIADDDGLTNVSYGYQWFADDAEITGATGSTYVLTSSEVGKTLKVRVSLTDDGGNEEVLTSTATGAVSPAVQQQSINTPATGDPTINGTAQVGETLTADTSGISDSDGITSVSYSYQWIRNDGTSDADISGATNSTYTLVNADEGGTIKVRVSFTDDAGNEEALTSAATAAVDAAPNNPATGAPAINGTAQVGDTLIADISGIADADGLANVAYSYQWIRNDGGTDTDISGATDSGYTLIDADEGRTIRVRVSFTDDGGNDETLTSAATAAVDAAPNNPATGAPAITGTAQVGETLTADTSGIADADGLDNVSYGYQWIRNDGGTDTDIQDATGSSYTLVDADEGKTIKVEVSFTDDGGNDESLTSTATGEVEPRPNSPATGAPTITGTAQIGETLTADTSAIADANGLTNATFSYQWVHNDGTSDTDISGGTDSTYTLAAADEGKTIKVEVSFTDDGGNDESLTSAATAAVDAAPNSPATGAPGITGAAQVGETLTADTSGIADANGLTNATFSYQWIRNDGTSDTDITGATNSTYTLVNADEGRTIKVRVSFTDDAGNDETLTSAAAAAVDAASNSPATGAPSITGTAQVGETLTADTSGIADADGLTNASYSYQWVAGGSDIAGATGSSHTLTSSEQEQAIQVRVSFTDDRSNAESLTSEATDAVAAAPAPFTVSLENNPASHDGQNLFTFEVRFSEEFDLSFTTLKLHAFTVTGGTVMKAQRTDKPSNIPWRITVQPDSNGDVIVVLPITNDCNSTGAICTGDGRKLSNSLNFTVSGPGG